MVSIKIDHHKVVREAISGRRKVDSEVLASMSILEERLEKLRKLGPHFAEIGFSAAAADISVSSAAMA
ncbi:MAG: hypothetical protein A2Y12_19750 [Planctomycetes bacterium GWF2_42_9]|nr:MAG: hypothetical protein A2Y12_19750 [Planctomycetes bacterium GWF2_42_9]